MLKENKELRTSKSHLKDGTDSLRKTKLALKDPIESLGKLKLAETYPEKGMGLIDKAKVEKQAEFFETVFDITPPLPEDIEDIDAGDNNSPLLMSMYIKDIYKYLTELEEKYSIEPDHLKKQVNCRSHIFNTFL